MVSHSIESESEAVGEGEPSWMSPSASNTVGMIAFLCTEAAFFSTLIMTYVFYRNDPGGSGPKPADVLGMALPISGTVCLLSSSATVMMAGKALRNDLRERFAFWIAMTIALGAGFLLETGLEWWDLIAVRRFTLQTNLFGSTFFTLIGFHAAHVTMGLLAMGIVLTLWTKGLPSARCAPGLELISLYWHFVDAVWILILGVVYLPTWRAFS